MSERDIFTAALEMTDPAARSVYLDQACAGDGALRQRVEMLLGTHGSAGDFLERPAAEPIEADGAPVQDTTAALDPADRPEPAVTRMEPGDDEKDAPLDFLQPSTKPGSLGRLGQYEVLDVLGRGGFGIVLRAFDELLHRVVAVKVMAPQLAATSPARRRFLREARASAAVRHENVVAIYNVAEQPIPYLVMEFIAGETVQQRLDRVGPLDAAEAARIGRQIAEGLAGAHAMGLIHRDVKPANILLESGADHVKITDFGLARAADDATLTQSGVIAGTPMYMAPEQALGETIDHRADLFSLGSVLYVMCSGRPPFRASTTMAVLKRVAEDTARPIREIIPEVPEWLCAIIAKLHAKSPEDRFASAKEVADLLARCLAELQRSGNVSPLPLGPATPQRSEPPRETVAPSPAAPRARRSGRRWMAAAAVLLLLLAGLGVTEFTGHTNLAGTVLRLFHLKREGPPVPEEPPPLAVAPFDAKQAREYQEAWAKHLHVSVEAENSIGMKLRLIPPGEFLMGSTQEEVDAVLKEAWPAHEGRIRSEAPPQGVRIAEPYFLGAYEVTVGQFRRFVAATGYRTRAEASGKGGAHWDAAAGSAVTDPADIWSSPRLAPSDEYPVGVISYPDAQAFCGWLAVREGMRYVLPDEKQWEYACRAGTTERWCSGDDPDEAQRFGWFSSNAGMAQPVGMRLPNAFGLFDMHGNVEEWAGNTPEARAERGGNYSIPAWGCRSATRFKAWENLAEEVPWVAFGFRVAVVGDLSKFNPDHPTAQGSRTVAEGPPPLAVAPFDAKQAREYQEAWAKHLHVSVEAENSIGMKLRLIPPGEFLMGSSQKEKDAALKQGSPGLEDCIRSEGPPHRVRVDQPFFLGECPVTAGQFRQFVAATKYQTCAETNGKGGMSWDGNVKGFVFDPKDVWNNPRRAPSDKHPVCVVALPDVEAFCAWLGAKEGLLYAPPTEEQWEYACRAGTTSYWCGGDDPNRAENFGWFGTNSGGIVHPAGELLPNAFGLFDMHGNVDELVRNTSGSPVQRGGGAGLSPWNCRSASRGDLHRSNPGVFVGLGFRVAVVGDLSKLKLP